MELTDLLEEVPAAGSVGYAAGLSLLFLALVAIGGLLYAAYRKSGQKPAAWRKAA